MAESALVTLDDVRTAANRIADQVLRTPLVAASWGEADRPLWLKPENLQVIGAFKVRGALNAVGALTEQERAHGLVTHSSGNHAQAVALAGREYAAPVTVVMPDTAPEVKIAATRALGAEVVMVPAAERESRTAELVAEHGYAYVPPYEHPDVIAGQGTIGLEILADLPDVATVLVPVGGGGLLSGVATAIKAMRPNVTMLGCEPELAGDAAESMRLGERRVWPVEQTYRTMADSLRTGLGELTWAHLHEYVDGILTVTEDAIAEAVRVLATRSRLVAEPGGAVTTAAYLSRSGELPEGPVVAVVSGGNIEPDLLVKLLTS